MAENNAVDPLRIDKNVELIRDAQKDIGATDVLVCGGCHEVYHFVEEFQEHKKSGSCPNTSLVKEKCQGEAKSQVWAFILWKNANYKSLKDGESPSSWEIYQEWCKLDIKQKDAWILAGKNIQTFSKLNDAKLIEVKVKPQTYARRSTLVTVPSLTSTNKSSSGDPLHEGEIRLSQLTEAQRIALKAQTEENKVSDDADPLGETGSSDLSAKSAGKDDVRKTNDLIKKGIVKPVQLNSDVTILPSNKKQNNKDQSKPTSGTKKDEEFAVEKIVSKRYNPKKKTFEYLVKWEDSDKNEYTWEPPANLESCKALVEEYEANLKKQRMQKAEAASLQKQYEKKKQKANAATADILEGRPQRSSKQKALDQVKAWCGDISDADEESGKRKHDDDDSDSDSFEKKMRMEEATDDSDDDNDKPSVTIKKIQKTNSMNGVGKKTPPIGKILIPDAKGIVRINQKQASELSSGVYIMSKTAGIIKLDSNTSKFATSGGQAIVKVEPRIGQTQIKVVKKEPAAGTMKLTQKLTPKPKITVRTLTKIPKREMLEKKPAASGGSVVEKKDPLFPEPDPNEESDDGVPDLEFPTDLPLPEPDSPPGDFILDPETGKIAGQEYPEDRPVVITEEPKKEEEHPVKIEEQPIKEENVEKPEGTLENLVNLAAADILGEELTTTADEAKHANEAKAELEKPVEEKPVQPKPTPTRLISAAQNRDLSNSVNSTPSILQRKLLSSPRQTGATTIRKVTPTLTPVKKNTPIISPVRSRIVSAKQKQFTPTNTPTISRVRHSYANKNLNVHKKIGQTTIYRTVQKPAKSSTHQIIHPQTLLQQHHQQQQQQQQQQQRQREAEMINTEVSMQALPTTSAQAAVINMPLLSVDEPSNPEQLQQPSEETATLSVPDTLTDLSTLAELNETDTPLLITGDDGTIYQVAGQNEQGQTILISQGADGQSQCLVVATESLQVEDNQVNETVTELHEPMVVEEPEAGAETEAGAADAEESMVAQLISADPPSPGGRRNVTVMLPDGSCVTMVVTQEQYESLELDK